MDGWMDARLRRGEVNSSLDSGRQRQSKAAGPLLQAPTRLG
jgi:hypothetical protein